MPQRDECISIEEITDGISKPQNTMKAEITITGPSAERLYNRIVAVSKGNTVSRPNDNTIVMNFDNVKDARAAMAKANRLMKMEGDYAQPTDGLTWTKSQPSSLRLDAAVAELETRKND